MIWTQEQRDELVRLWDGGKRSYSERATILGLTKNQVVGRMRREKRIRGLEVEDQHSHPSKFPKPKRINPLIPVARRKRMTEELRVPDQSRVATIVDVTGCRWAVSFDENVPGGHLFCNHATDGKTYCPYHAAEGVASYSRSLISKTVRSAWHAYKKKVAA